MSFPIIRRTEENATYSPDPFSNLPKALKSILITFGLLIATSLVPTWKTRYQARKSSGKFLTQAPGSQQTSLKARSGQQIRLTTSLRRDLFIIITCPFFFMEEVVMMWGIGFPTLATPQAWMDHPQPCLVSLHATLEPPICCVRAPGKAK